MPYLLTTTLHVAERWIPSGMRKADEVQDQYKVEFRFKTGINSMYVSIFGIDLSSLGMGPCARLRRLGAIVWVSLRRHEQIYRLGLGFRDSGRRGGSRAQGEHRGVDRVRHARRYFGGTAYHC